jgi:hypothetical protein
MERERPLDADAERVLADGEGLAHARALTLDADALEHLDALPVALDHLEVDADGISGLEGRDVTQLPPLDALDDRAHEKGRPRAGGG